MKVKMNNTAENDLQSVGCEADEWLKELRGISKNENKLNDINLPMPWQYVLKNSFKQQMQYYAFVGPDAAEAEEAANAYAASLAAQGCKALSILAVEIEGDSSAKTRARIDALFAIGDGEPLCVVLSGIDSCENKKMFMAYLSVAMRRCAANCSNITVILLVPDMQSIPYELSPLLCVIPFALPTYNQRLDRAISLLGDEGFNKSFFREFAEQTDKCSLQQMDWLVLWLTFWKEEKLAVGSDVGEDYKAVFKDMLEAMRGINRTPQETFVQYAPAVASGAPVSDVSGSSKALPSSAADANVDNSENRILTLEEILNQMEERSPKAN